LAANTSFADEHNPAQVLAREWAVQLPKASKSCLFYRSLSNFPAAALPILIFHSYAR
jgi:hypothetical protein